MRIPFKIKHCIDDVFQHAGAGQSAVLRDVPHKKERRPGGLRQPRQPCRTFPPLRDAPRSTVEGGTEERLNGVDHHEFGLAGNQSVFDFFEFDFAHQLQPVRINRKAFGAHRYLA